jgi:hypothetical protein
LIFLQLLFQFSPTIAFRFSFWGENNNDKRN